MLGKPVGVAQLREYTGGIGPVDTMVNYTPEQVYQVLDQLGEIGRSAYFRFVILDLVYMDIYVSFFLVGITLFLRQLLPDKTNLHWIKLAPVFAWGADLLENSLSLVIFVNYPERLMDIALYMNIFTLAKFFLFSISSLILVFLFLWWVWEGIQN
jgi:hypothetical protein